ncbi:type VII secretion target [Amycolatopsis sp.]|jgi:hypothetical protein|uniref:type VII secretion target n=1 Tax=Amycolatopsis sp. TaxID=37632 RepID=UPI002DFB2C58|nr:type VII secretion target [Amycolatopsis sp.]
MADGYEVLGGELGIHAGKIDGFADRLRTAVDAARQVSMDNSAYGVICQPFALMLDPFEQMGVQALQTGSDSVDGTAGKIRDAATAYQAREDATAEAITKAGPVDA